MQQAALDKKNLEKFVGAMLKRGKVRGPVSDAGTGSVVLGDLSKASELVLDYANFKLPPKREFFPQCENIATFDAGGLRQAVQSGENAIVFGIRPCDARSFLCLDKVFDDAHYTDPYYRNRRDHALVIALACEKPGYACFCSSVGGGPAAAAGADILACILADSLVFEALSEKGQSFLEENKALLRNPTPGELQKRKQQEEHSRTAPTRIRIDSVPREIGKNFDSPLWDTMAETCLGCGVCTFLCPTCHCFDLFDERQEKGGRKLRVHDACMFASFTREASGHNPRGKRGDRLRQRVMHKFSYAPEKFGDIFCVGCGRCIMHCPSNIDIRETVSRVTI